MGVVPTMPSCLEACDAVVIGLENNCDSSYRKDVTRCRSECQPKRLKKEGYVGAEENFTNEFPSN